MMGICKREFIDVSRFIYVLLAMSLVSICTVIYYDSDLHRRVRVMSTVRISSNGTKEQHTIVGGMKAVDKGLNKLEVVSPGGAIPSVINRLSESVTNIEHLVEHDVLNFNVDDILKSLSDIPFEESRLVHKIQQKQKNADFKCVIRITKYCSKRCDLIVQRIHLTEWTRFSCGVSEACQVETRFVGNLTREIMQSSDVLFIVPSLHQNLQLERLVASRPPGQLWVLYSRESPSHDPEYAPQGLTGNPFNLTMTYARDADIHFTYATLRERKQGKPPSIPKKTKLIAWMSSNCRVLSWRRVEFVKELQQHISVDTYGKCGSMGKLATEDTAKTLKQYKFYLAFENSECRDYITEKPWRHALSEGAVPIVYGAKRKDYEELLPRNSFIFVEDFSNMSAFVDYIHALDEDKARYREFFNWRSESTVISMRSSSFTIKAPKVNMCYLLKKLVHLFFHPETSWQKRTPDFASWWRGQCIDPSTEKNVLGFSVRPTKSNKKNREENNVVPR